MTSSNKSVTLGHAQRGTMSPGQSGVVIPVVNAQVEMVGLTGDVGEAIYNDMSATLIADGQLTTGNAELRRFWRRGAPTGNNLYLGPVGVITRIVGDDGTNRTVEAQFQGIVENVNLQTGVSANDELTFTAPGQLNTAAAEDRVVAQALTDESGGTGTVFLLGPFAGVIGAFT